MMFEEPPLYSETDRQIHRYRPDKIHRYYTKKKYKERRKYTDLRGEIHSD